MAFSNKDTAWLQGEFSSFREEMRGEFLRLQAQTLEIQERLTVIEGQVPGCGEELAFNTHLLSLRHEVRVELAKLRERLHQLETRPITEFLKWLPGYEGHPSTTDTGRLDQFEKGKRAQ